MKGTKKIKTTLFRQYLCNSELGTTKVIFRDIGGVNKTLLPPGQPSKGFYYNSLQNLVLYPLNFSTLLSSYKARLLSDNVLLSNCHELDSEVWQISQQARECSQIPLRVPKNLNWIPLNGFDLKIYSSTDYFWR